MDQIQEYEAIADLFAESMRLPFRAAIEQYTLQRLLGDVDGAKALDMGCGDGFYTRYLRRAGASQAMGVDVSTEMVRLAEAHEARQPLGCTYRQADIAGFKPAAPVDIVVAMYSLGYAQSAEQLRGFCRACHDALRPGGRFVGLNDNVRNPPPATGSWSKYGLERVCPDPPSEGDTVRYTITNADGRRFEVTNYYLAAETYAAAFHDAGFRDFAWVDLALHPRQQGDGFWDDFMQLPPLVAFAASRPA